MGAVDSQFVAALAGTPGGTWMAATGEEQPGSASYGVSLLSRYPVVSWRGGGLPPLRGSAPPWSSMARRPLLGRDEPRVAGGGVRDRPFRQLSACKHPLAVI